MGMDVVVEWLRTELGVSFSGLMYIFAAVAFVFGLLASGYKMSTDNHSTGRDFANNLGLTAIATGILVAGGMFVPSLLGG